MKRLIPLLVIIIMLILVGCGDHKSSVKIGVLLPMTGSSANYGDLMRKGAELAAENVNRNGGIDGKKLELVFEDSKGQPKDGVAALNKLIASDKVPAALIAFSGVIQASVPVAQSNKIVLLNCPANSPKFRNQEYLWNINVLSDQEGKALADFARKTLAAKTVAILYVNNDSGQGFQKVFAQEFAKQGGNVVVSEGHDQGTKDFRTSLARVQAAKPDVVFLATYYLESGLIMKQVRELGLDSKCLSYSSILTPDFLEIAGSAANGIVCSQPGFDPNDSRPEATEYAKAYKSKYGQDAEMWGAQFYDGVMVIAEAMKSGSKTGQEINNAMLCLAEVQGASGPIKFAPDHTVSRSIRFKIVQNGEFRDYRD